MNPLIHINVLTPSVMYADVKMFLHICIRFLTGCTYFCIGTPRRPIQKYV